MKTRFLVAASSASMAAAALLASPAAAQSTGALDFEEDTIIVTGALQLGVGGVEIPDTPKAKQVLNQEVIREQRPGQTVNDIVNLVPGVSFQNNDPWGSSGGSFTIRGFGADRVSQTVDGIPLNDSGNYAMYTNQQVDSEVLESVNVNLGVTDIDSPTASAAGGTINIRTRRPADEFGITATFSYGDVVADGAGSRPYKRAFGMIDTGDLSGFGTYAFVSGSYTKYDNAFNNYGQIQKTQFNGRIFQDLGSNGDFLSISGHYNENRNNFAGSKYRATELQDLVDAGEKRARFYDINYPCTITSSPGVFETPAEVAAPGYVDPDGVNGCGADFDRRWNPSNTGNIRGSARLTLADNLILTLDPSYQYVKANGGGNEELLEGTRTINGVEYTGFIRGGYYFGRDLNGDGDMLDEVSGFDPSQTRTHRFGVIGSLAYEISDQHRVRLAYTWDHANHRQTGMTSMADINGDIQDVFPINDPLFTVDGFALNKRDRKSFAILNKVAGEYRGRFLEDDLTVVLGLAAPFFTRKLDQRCYTTSASGYIDCLGNQDTTAYEAANPNAAPPQKRTYKYDKLLPSAGFTYFFVPDASVFANYAKGISVPGTDPLYDSFYLDYTPEARPVPETTDSFDLGFRYQSGIVEAQIAGWFTRYNNRLATSYDPVLDEYLYRNLGRVDKYGIDASVAIRPTTNTLLYVFGSLNESEIKDDIQEGVDGDGLPVFLPTAGNRESGAPAYSFGARGQVSFGEFDLGAQVKHTGSRWVNDIHSAKTGSYTVVDLDLRYTVGQSPLGGDIALQLNVSNLFDEFYVGGYDGSLDNSGPNVQIGAPRAISGSILFGF
ncbi:iron complex outermembrane receptor protein [Altererythrobacter atlanticus]|uniref:Ferrichrome outer membrane transporter n=1 Tax=Croceibacterium atlanticum TaxID=1267766 RepID=A0A0F7KQF5_9SPHN|nr:TonB-dependent receptor [Croceibacterium atlanticum]AKH41814.1 ferrichrome outer membrane transporter [Croceibacterium atlanticum]MBB5733280.1 iron complex outermembrane receptor protein [Croceibacterium atlanticum]